MPAPTPVTVPSATVATDVSDDDHLSGPGGVGLPSTRPSTRITAVEPTWTVGGGSIGTSIIAGSTTSVHCTVLSSSVPVTVASPGPTATICPSLTVATLA